MSLIDEVAKACDMTPREIHEALHPKFVGMLVRDWNLVLVALRSAACESRRSGRVAQADKFHEIISEVERYLGSDKIQAMLSSGIVLE
jgi:hypothetical protein